MRELRGIPASPGVVSAPAFVLKEDDIAVPSYPIEAKAVPGEWARFETAAEKARLEVAELRDRTLKAAGADQAAIFDAHLLMMSDPEFLESLQERLGSTLRNIERIIVDLETELVDKLSRIEDASLQARSADIHDISRRILSHLMERTAPDLSTLGEDVVLVAHDLLPSDMIALKKGRVRGIVTEAGGKTSHVAILARAFELPAVLGLGKALSGISSGDILVVDGDGGRVLLQPDAEALKDATAAQAAARAAAMSLAQIIDLPSLTSDGQPFILKANIEVPEEAEAAWDHGAGGIGLFRSEFLFFQPGHIPGEEEQYRAYRQVVETMKGRPVTIRTLDIGGDKVLPELGALDEKNPLLGWRAIRFCLAKQDVFLAQLRAILRAAAHGDVRIMLPMIASADELDQAFDLLHQARRECKQRGYEVSEDIKAGIMIEIPAAALMSDILARKADFFSIGTNDLTQYTMAVDRGNERVAYLYEPFNPAVIRLIKMTIDNGRAAGIPVGMCGEMAADPAAALLLLGLGLEEFSMSSASLLRVKRLLRSVNKAEAEKAAREVLGMSSSKEVSAYLSERVAAYCRDSSCIAP